MSSAASVLQKRGKEAIVAQILGYLDWRSLLRASEVCANLNDVVASSSALQLELRRAFYALPDDDVRPDLPPKEELERLVDVQRRWAAVEPVRVDQLLLGGKSNLFRLMHGLLVVAWEEEEEGGGDGDEGAEGTGNGDSDDEDEDDSDADDEDDDDDSMNDGAEFTEPMSTAIRVYDLTTLRYLPPDTPLDALRSWTFRPGFPFRTLQISPADNLLVVSSFDTELVDEGVMVEKSYSFYVLDPARAGLDLEDLGTDPFPHPQAIHPVLHFNDLYDAPDPDDYDVESANQWADCDFHLTARGTIVVLSPQDSKASVWDWRSGERVLDAESSGAPGGIVDAYVPTYGRDMLAVGVSRYGGGDKDVSKADGVHVSWLSPGREGEEDTVVCGDESLDTIGMPVELASEVRPAAVKWHLRFPIEAGSQWTTQLDTDVDVAHRAGHPLLFVAAAAETYGYAAMIRLDKLRGRLDSGTRKPLALGDWVDLADWSTWHDQGDVLASVYGLTAVLIQAPTEDDGDGGGGDRPGDSNEDESEDGGDDGSQNGGGEEGDGDGRRRYTIRVANYGLRAPCHATVLASRHEQDHTPAPPAPSTPSPFITFSERHDASRPSDERFETGMLLDNEAMAAQKQRKKTNVRFSTSRPWGYAATSRELSWPEEMGELYRVDMGAEHAVLSVGDGLVILSF
ncbi:uncharacterized protein LOC62_03G004230 [Vanrija pseudolonga]|uniref:F-box domain-containing protein n=1 Tax=Vanrija pseudolonga TaxID=143232 RepID=A0AAF1BQB5_9TREE|nr:hypothetical protein LOC62_03G004230 [Vanrija pseudolonga]